MLLKKSADTVTDRTRERDRHHRDRPNTGRRGNGQGNRSSIARLTARGHESQVRFDQQEAGENEEEYLEGAADVQVLSLSG